MIHSIYWFRQDLRLHDNPALCEAAQRGDVLCIYILEDHDAGDDRMGAASRVWLHHSLASLNQSLGGKLAFYEGSAEAILRDLVEQHQPHCITWNRCYEPWRMERDARIKRILKDAGVEVISMVGNVLWEPPTIQKNDGTPYRVFTPFYTKGCLNAPPPAHPLPAPSLSLATPPANARTLDALNLLPTIAWDAPLIAHWNIGEAGALQQMDWFLDSGIGGYAVGRDVPSKKNVSRLSPYLHFGELSVRALWYATQQTETTFPKDTQKFRAELGWREFSHYLLYHHHGLRVNNFTSKFDDFAWKTHDDHLSCWQRGMTGYPIIDAGMRELYHTGYMHNRVRMITASFLVKNLLIDWRLGEQWFWDCLFDADHANNAASWQWVAGCGADAAPYFRIFNPILQAQKFDPSGHYIRRYVPELHDLPDKYLACPWEAPTDILRSSGVQLGKHYPKPIIDFSESRKLALQSYSDLTSSSDI